MFFRKLRCSFCHRDESQVAKLVAGPRVYICDRCAYETVRIMETTPPADAAPLTRSSAWKRLLDGARSKLVSWRVGELVN
jgi:ATP-dependent Clp protease ATP-binding subunit ClpX